MWISIDEPAFGDLSRSPAVSPMKVFLSFPPDARAAAAQVEASLNAAGHEVLRDLGNLFEATARNQSLARKIGAADRFVCLVTRSVSGDADTLHELDLARGKWPDPAGRVIAVHLPGSDPAAAPPYLRGADALHPADADPRTVGDAVVRALGDAGRPAASSAPPIDPFPTPPFWPCPGQPGPASAPTGGPGSTAPIKTLLAPPPPRRRPRLRGALLLTALVAAAPVGWALMSLATDDDDRAPTAARPLPDDVRHRVADVAVTYDGFAVAVSDQVVLFDRSGARLTTALRFPGRVTALGQTPHRLLAATRDPGRLYVFDSRNWAPMDTFDLEGAPEEVGSLAVASGVRWAASAAPGEAVVRLDGSNRVWLGSPYRPPVETTVRLREANDQLWAVARDAFPSSLVRVGPSEVKPFSGAEIDELRCARDAAESAAGHLLVLSCENELVEMALDGDSPRILNRRATLSPERGARDADLHRIVCDGQSVFVALNTFASDQRRTPRRARVARIDAGGAEPRALFDRPDAAVTGMAVTPLVVVVTLRRADGTADAVYFPRG